MHEHARTHTAHSSTPHTCDRWFLILGTFEVFLYQLRCDTDHMLALPVLDHVEGLQSADDIILGDAGHLAVEKDLSMWNQQKDERQDPCLILGDPLPVGFQEILHKVSNGTVYSGLG